jgi:hypothetical protein
MNGVLPAVNQLLLFNGYPTSENSIKCKVDIVARTFYAWIVQTSSNWRSPLRVHIMTAALFLACAGLAHSQTVVYVDDDANPGGDGTSWATAYDNLASALAAISAGEVWVAEGFYTPGSPGDETASFVMQNNVAIYGGFNGTETSRNQRDWIANVTALSGDLGGDDEYGFNFNIHTANSDHVVRTVDVDASGILDGFTVIGGHSAFEAGAGIFIQGGNPNILNCSFEWNVAGFTGGGGASALDANPVFEACRFINNWSHLFEGGALYVSGTSDVIVRDCDFSSNTCTGSGREAAGGAISCWGNSLLIERCAFNGNVARGFWPENDVGGYGGAVHCIFGELTVVASSFDNNWSNAGGAIWTWTDTLIVNCVFRNNQAPDYSRENIPDWGGVGGAIGSSSFSERTVNIINATIYGNSAEKGGGINIGGAFNALVANSVLWENTDRAANVGPSQIRGAGASYSCIQNMLIGEPDEDPPDPDDFPHCIDFDPLFVDGSGGDYHLLAGSPCIDAADNTVVPLWVTSDFDGQLRVVDDPNTIDTGNGMAPIVDMGAFEVQPESFGVNADGYNALRGAYVAGDLSDVQESDDSYLKYNPGLTLDASEPPVWIEFEGRLPNDSPTSLSVTLEASANTPNVNQTIEAFNWLTGQYEQVDTQSASFNNDSMVTVDLTAEIGKYVESGTGGVKTRTGWKAGGLVLQFPWTVCIDQIVWTIAE